jgi:hypothetical protein
VRIVPDNAKFGLRDKTKVGFFKSYEPTFDIKDTIEITDDEWDEIYEGYDEPTQWQRRFNTGLSFAQYLRELLKLKREVGQ